MTANIEFQINLFNDDATWCWCLMLMEWGERGRNGKLIVINTYLCERWTRGSEEFWFCNFVADLSDLLFLTLKLKNTRKISMSWFCIDVDKSPLLNVQSRNHQSIKNKISASIVIDLFSMRHDDHMQFARRLEKTTISCQTNRYHRANEWLMSLTIHYAYTMSM